MKTETKATSSTGHEFDVRFTDFRCTAPEQIRVMIYQFCWPADHFVLQDGVYCHGDVERNLRLLTSALKLAEEQTVDLLVFPELAVPEDATEEVRNWSERTGATVVCGSHYKLLESGYTNRSPIFVSGTALFTHKINPAPSELSPISGEGVVSGKELILVRNSPVGTIGVLICADYLDSKLKSQLPLDDVDVLCVPAFQRDSGMYHDRMNLECGERHHGQYIMYANASVPGASDGDSAIFGMMHNMYHAKLVHAGYTDQEQKCRLVRVGEGNKYIIADISLKEKKPPISNTLHSKPNVTLSAIGEMIIEDTESFAEQIGRTDEAYSDIETFYVQPKEYEELLQLLEKNNFVFIIGDPGIGKTYTAVRLLKEYFDRGRKVRWLSGADVDERAMQRKILENYEPNENEVVYFEDPFGRTTYENRDTLRTAFQPLIDSLIARNSKLIVTSRKSVFEKFSEEAITALELSEFAHEMNIVKPSYDGDRLVSILDKLAKGAAWQHDQACAELVTKSIFDGKFETPLSLRDFTRSSAHIDNPVELADRISKRQKEERSQFSAEISESEFSTVLLLSLVFFFGSHPTKTLSRWFNKIGQFMNPHGSWVGTAPLFKSLRSQLGHRVEHRGRRAKVIRFIHPYYEEAFKLSYMSDLGVSDVVNTTISAIARENLYGVMVSIFRIAIRHPDATKHLLSHIKPILRTPDNSAELAYTVNRLSGLEIHFWSNGYRESLEELISLEEFRAFVVQSEDMTEISFSLRALYNYSNVMRATKKDITEEIEALLERMLSSSNYAPLIEGFYFLISMYQRIERKLLRATLREDVQTKILQLRDHDRRRFMSVFYRNGIVKGPDIKRLQKVLETGYSKAPLRVTDLHSMASDDYAIIIDDGAYSALKNESGSLLPPGIIGVRGEFGEGEVVVLQDSLGSTIGYGITQYSSAQIDQIKGAHSALIAEKLGLYRGSSVVPKHKCLILPQ